MEPCETPISGADTLYGSTSIEQYIWFSARCYNAFQLTGVHNAFGDKQHVLQITNDTHDIILHACCFVYPCKSIFTVTTQP